MEGQPRKKRAKLEELLDSPFPKEANLSSETKSHSSCGKCHKPLLPKKKTVAFHGTLFHSECFVCSTCGSPLDQHFEKDGLVYCKEHFLQVIHPTPAQQPLEGKVTFTVSNVAEYQVANYNIYPTPSLSCDKPLPVQMTVYAHLLDETMKTTVSGGFVDGDIRVIKSQQTKLQLTGLKLNRTSGIKDALHLKKGKSIDHKFSVQLIIGEDIIVSNSFQIVSSVSQLPESIRSEIRPRVGKEESIEVKSKTAEAATSELSLTIQSLKLQLDHALLSGNVQLSTEYASQIALLYQQLVALEKTLPPVLAPIQ
jgi:hypothetical protein